MAKQRVLVVEADATEARVVQNGQNEQSWQPQGVVVLLLLLVISVKGLVFFACLIEGALEGKAGVSRSKDEPRSAEELRVQASFYEARSLHLKSLLYSLLECVENIHAHRSSLEEAEGTGKGAKGVKLRVLLLVAGDQLVFPSPFARASYRRNGPEEWSEQFELLEVALVAKIVKLSLERRIHGQQEEDELGRVALWVGTPATACPFLELLVEPCRAQRLARVKNLCDVHHLDEGIAVVLQDLFDLVL